MRRLFVLSCLFFLCSQGLMAEIYRYTDDNGRTVYSDKAPKNNEPIRLPALNILPAIDITEPLHEFKTAPALDDNNIRINSPSDGAILPNGLVPTPLSTSTDRVLRDGQQIRISLNGQTLYTSTSPNTIIKQLPRGRHQISVTLIDRNGKMLSEDSINIMVYRPTN